MIQNVGNAIAGEAASQLPYGTPVAMGTTGIWAAAAADARVDGVVIGNSGNTAPYMHTIQVDGVCQVLSDGAATIAIGDYIAAGATSQAKKRAIADGATARYFLGVSLSALAATQGLLCDVILSPFTIPNT